MCCSRSLMAAAIAPTWRPAVRPMTNRSRIIASQCWLHFSRWRMGFPAWRCLTRLRKLSRQRAPDVFESFMSVEEMGAVEEVEASLELVQKAARQGHSGLASIGLFVERAGPTQSSL